jgi:hypothetical protein
MIPLLFALSLGVSTGASIGYAIAVKRENERLRSDCIERVDLLAPATAPSKVDADADRNKGYDTLMATASN